MRILIVHNAYGAPSGEETVVNSIWQTFAKRQHDVRTFFRSSEDIRTARDKVIAFASGVYNPIACRELSSVLSDFVPDVVNVHNLFPFISPPALKTIRRSKTPIVMTVHNYRLVCPTGLHMRDGEICELCNGGREYNCALHNCTGSLFKSSGYAIRNATARKLGFYRNNVSAYAALTSFQKNRLIAAGFDPRRIHVIPNMVDTNVELRCVAKKSISYVGRISEEKGVDIFLRAAKELPHLNFQIAGSTTQAESVLDDIPDNVTYRGILDPDSLQQLYQESIAVVVPSRCFEGFPMVIPEAMVNGTAVICARTGGLTEVIQESVNGFTFERGDVCGLIEAIRRITNNVDSAREMGMAARTYAEKEFAEDTFYRRMVDLFDLVMRENQNEH